MIVRYEGDFDAAPTRVILALDHVMFIGVMTNSLFGLMAASARRSLWPRADHLIVAGTNIGVAGFAVGLLADVTAIKRAFTPLLGASGGPRGRGRVGQSRSGRIGANTAAGSFCHRSIGRASTYSSISLPSGSSM